MIDDTQPLFPSIFPYLGSTIDKEDSMLSLRDFLDEENKSIPNATEVTLELFVPTTTVEPLIEDSTLESKPEPVSEPKLVTATTIEPITESSSGYSATNFIYNCFSYVTGMVYNQPTNTVTINTETKTDIISVNDRPIEPVIIIIGET